MGIFSFPFYMVKNYCTRCCRQRSFRNLPFPSRVIFWPSGHTMPIRGAFKCRGGLCLSIGSNGTRVQLRLNKLTAPRWCRQRLFWKIRFPVRQYSCCRAYAADPGGLSNAVLLIYINWKPMDPLPT